MTFFDKQILNNIKVLGFFSLKITLSKLYLLIVGFVSYDLINSNNILLPGNGYPFNSNRVAGDFKEFVENEHYPLVEVKNTRDLVLNWCYYFHDKHNMQWDLSRLIEIEIERK